MRPAWRSAPYARGRVEFAPRMLPRSVKAPCRQRRRSTRISRITADEAPEESPAHRVRPLHPQDLFILERLRDAPGYVEASRAASSALTCDDRRGSASPRHGAVPADEASMAHRPCIPDARSKSRLARSHGRRRLRVVSDADPHGSSGSPQMKPRRKAPHAESLPYTPKIVIFLERLRDATGRSECPERKICVAPRRSAPICVASDTEPGPAERPINAQEAGLTKSH